MAGPAMADSCRSCPRAVAMRFATLCLRTWAACSGLSTKPTAIRIPFGNSWAFGPRACPARSAVQHSADAGVEDLLDRLDKAANAKVINGDFTEVEDESA
jgi:hypothetical protein